MKKVGAGALFRDASSRVLLVNPTYKAAWEIPGGVVEEGESPRQACERELAEELGFLPPVGRLLVVDWLPDLNHRGDLILFIFDGGIVDESFAARISLPAEELSESRFVELDDLPEHLGPGMVRRVRAAVTHAAASTTGYLEFGWPDGLPPPGTSQAM